MRTEPIDKWVRALVDDTVVVDSRRPLLFWEEDFPVPGYAFVPEDVRTDLLTPNPAEPTGPFFHRPHGPVAEFYDLAVGDRVLPQVAWRRDDPALADRIVFSWGRPGIDRWLEEDEEVHSHPRDPHHRVEVLQSSRHVVVSLDGTVLADSHRPVLLFETGLPTRFYLPVEDVVTDALEPAETRSRCPYKGVAERYWSVAGRPDAKNVAWSYPEPLPAVDKIAGRIAFYNELVDLTVDGELQPRPESPFSRREHRPAGDAAG
jgi:uncharacterized protein (DUF427 family)